MFEYDINKSESNRLKHGIDFVQAQALWDDPDRLEIPAKTVDEPRMILIAVWNNKYWTAVYTWRENTLRIISVRRSRKSERSAYESGTV